jgi:hypothetical protein
VLKAGLRLIKLALKTLFLSSKRLEFKLPFLLLLETVLLTHFHISFQLVYLQLQLDRLLSLLITRLEKIQSQSLILLLQKVTSLS